MDWGCYSRMQQLFAAHPEYRTTKAVAEQLRYPDSDAAYTMCNMGITDEASLLKFINPPITQEKILAVTADMVAAADMVAEIAKIKSYYEGGESAPLIEKEKEETLPKTLLTIVVVVVILTMVLR